MTPIALEQVAHPPFSRRPKMKMRAFDMMDHETFSGAEAWEIKDRTGAFVDFRPPLIGEGTFSDGTEFVLVADPDGVELVIDGDPYHCGIPFEKQIYAEEFCALFHFDGESKDAAIALFTKLAS